MNGIDIDENTRKCIGIVSNPKSVVSPIPTINASACLSPDQGADGLWLALNFDNKHHVLYKIPIICNCNI